MSQFYKPLAKFVSGQVLAQTLNVLFIGIIARTSGVDNLGSYSIIQSCFGLVGLLIGVRLSEPASKFLAEYINDVEAQALVIAASLQVSLFVAILNFSLTSLFFIYWQPKFISYSLTYWPFIFYGSYILLTFPVVTWQLLARYAQRNGVIFLTSVIDPLLKLIGLVVLILCNINVSIYQITLIVFGSGIIVSILSILSINNICNRLNIKTRFGLHIYSHPKLAGFKSLISKSFFMDSANGIAGKADVIILGYIVGESSAGLYRVAKSVYSISSTLIASIRTYWFYDIVLEIKNNKKISLLNFFLNHKRLWVLVAALNIMLGVVTWNFSDIIFGASFDGLKFVYLPFIVTGVVTGLTFWLNSLFIASNRTGLLVRIVLFNACLSVVLMFPFSYYTGAIGMSIVTMLSAIVQAFTTVQIYSKHC